MSRQCDTVMESQCTTVDQTDCRTESQEVCETVTDMTCHVSEVCTTVDSPDCQTVWKTQCTDSVVGDPRQAVRQTFQGNIKDLQTVPRVVSVTTFSDGTSRDPTKSSSIIDR